MEKETIKKVIIPVIIFLIVLTFVFGILHMDYKLQVEQCCEGYRQYVLENQIGGECSHWTFLDDLKGIRGCVVEDLNPLGGNKNAR